MPSSEAVASEPVRAPGPSTSAVPRAGSDYSELSRQVKEAGLLRRRPGYYTWSITLTTLALLAGWAAFVLIGNSWWTLAVAVFLAVMFTQVGFLGHDAGHRQIFASRRASYVTGLLLGNLGIGLSYGWWVAKHSRHHANPNTEGEDPDIATGALAFTSAQVASSSAMARRVYRCQAYLFFPMLLLEALHLHVASLRALARPTAGARYRGLEITLLVAHIAAYLTVVLLVLGPVKAIAFIAIQQGLFGLYLGCSFAPNHKGMRVLSAAEKLDYLRRQVLTSRNVRGGVLTDFALGGLNYQIEHHLFPSMPRPSLRRSQPLIRAFCEQHGVTYSQTGLPDSFAQVLRHLNRVGMSSATGSEA
jgi:fatty acid desaturase